MTCYYKALYSDPGSADLVYAKLKNQFPNLDMHIEEPDKPQQQTAPFHSTAYSETEMGSEVTFAMLAPLTSVNLGPSEVLSNTMTVGPSPYGAIEGIFTDTEPTVPSPPSKTMIYGSCGGDIKGALLQNFRRYGADAVIVSKTPV